jgi:hypothetical protein
MIGQYSSVKLMQNGSTTCFNVLKFKKPNAINTLPSLYGLFCQLAVGRRLVNALKDISIVQKCKG